MRGRARRRGRSRRWRDEAGVQTSRSLPHAREWLQTARPLLRPRSRRRCAPHAPGAAATPGLRGSGHVLPAARVPVVTPARPGKPGVAGVRASCGVRCMHACAHACGVRGLSQPPHHAPHRPYPTAASAASTHLDALLVQRHRCECGQADQLRFCLAQRLRGPRRAKEAGCGVPLPTVPVVTSCSIATVVGCAHGTRRKARVRWHTACAHAEQCGLVPEVGARLRTQHRSVDVAASHDQLGQLVMRELPCTIHTSGATRGQHRIASGLAPHVSG